MSQADNDYCDPSIGNYGYVPSLAAGVFFSVLFGLYTLYSLYATIRQRKWFLAIVLGGILETLGWATRAAANRNVCSQGLFITQICCLIVGPAFFSAALYIVLGILILKAPELSDLKPRSYIILFCSVDFLSLLLQAIGGGIASSADTDVASKNGSDIIVGGVFVQLAGMSAFVALACRFLWKAKCQDISFNRQVLIASFFATLLIFIRNIYRAVELLGGWNGYINTTEGFLIGLDGVCMLLCISSLCHLAIVDATSNDDCLNRNKEADEKDLKNSGRNGSLQSNFSDSIV